MAMDPEALEAIIQAAVVAATSTQATANREIVEAAVNAAAAQYTTATQTMRKPTLPPFNPKDIDVWLRQVDAANKRPWPSSKGPSGKDAVLLSSGQS